MMEKIIAYHCAPALAGIKPSNIVSCYKDKISDIPQKIEKLNFELNSKDIYVERLCECKRKVLVMVYRKKQLEKALNNKKIREFLIECGYPKEGDLNAYIDRLKHRLREEEFPHEIGAFLGYPMHDIDGFIHHKDECLLCGEWKVYADAEGAKALFDRFNKCRRALFERIESGRTLAQMFC